MNRCSQVALSNSEYDYFYSKPQKKFPDGTSLRPLAVYLLGRSSLTGVGDSSMLTGRRYWSTMVGFVSKEICKSGRNKVFYERLELC